MTSVLILLPLLAAVGVLLAPAKTRFDRIGVGVAAAIVAIVAAMALAFEPGGGVQFQDRAAWIPAIGVGYSVGLDGLSLPLVAMTALVFLAAFLFDLGLEKTGRRYVALMLFLEGACIGVFVALDLILFFVFWDLSLVGMYFLIAYWGHERSREAALKFFLYTFLGSLALLLGIIGLALGADPIGFDMIALAEERPRAGEPLMGALVFLALFVGFAIKTPIVPLHTWLPPAHVEAPASGSAILAGVMLKMGTYGFVRIAMAIMPEQWRDFALAIVVLGVASALYGALVALAQTSFKRLVAFTSINHMGYVMIGLGAVGLAAADGEGAAANFAASGAITQMVAHGLVTGLLFLMTGVLHRRAGTYEFDRLGGLSATAPVFAAVTACAAFASLGLPGLVQFVAEFQIFVGSFAAVPLAVVLALVAVLITAGLFLWSLQRLFLGPLAPQGRTMSDLSPGERAAAIVLLVPIVGLGLFPAPLLAVIEPAASRLVALFAG